MDPLPRRPVPVVDTSIQADRYQLLSRFGDGVSQVWQTTLTECTVFLPKPEVVDDDDDDVSMRTKPLPLPSNLEKTLGSLYREHYCTRNSIDVS